MITAFDDILADGLKGIAVTTGLTLAIGLIAIRLVGTWATPSRLRMLLSLGTGYLLALAFVELLPHSYAHFNQSFAVTGTIALLGAGFVWGTEKIYTKGTKKVTQADQTKFTAVTSAKHEHKPGLLGSHKACCGIDDFTNLNREVVYSAIGCIFVCAFFDGVTLSAALIAESSSPLRAYSGVLAHVVPEVMLAGIIARVYYKTEMKAFLVCLVASLLFALGNTASRIAVWLGTSEGVLLGLAAGMMSYIAVAHLIPKFMSGRREIAMAAAGFCCFLLTEMVHHHHV
jgi:zinc transporter ZupT